MGNSQRSFCCENFVVKRTIYVDMYIDFVRTSQAASMECFIVICNVNTIKRFFVSQRVDSHFSFHLGRNVIHGPTENYNKTLWKIAMQFLRRISQVRVTLM